MKSNLFKNFKTLKEKESEIAEPTKDLVSEKMDNVSVKEEVLIPHTKEKTESKKDKTKKIVEPVAEKNILTEKPKETAIVTPKVAKANPAKPVNPYAKRLDSSVQKKSFTIFLKDDSLEFLKDFVFYKVTGEKLIFYNQSDALVEALDLIRDSFGDIPERPKYIREQEKMKKGGRKRNSDEVYSSTTSCYIPVTYWDFIKDVSYSKVISGNMYYKDWDLIEIGVETLRKKYKGLVLPRPDYIREDEMQRGRRTKNADQGA